MFYDDISCVEWPDKVQPLCGFVPDTLDQHNYTTTFEYLDNFARA